jgi:hypothetical protein
MTKDDDKIAAAAAVKDVKDVKDVKAAEAQAQVCL